MERMGLDMNKLLFLLPLVALVLVAADPAPTEPLVFEAGGAVCVFYGGQLECFCRCTVDCTQESTPVPTPAPTSVPPTERPPCNRGLGNGAEGCDPGNSSGRPGAAGEQNE